MDPLTLEVLRQQLSRVLGPDIGMACSGVDGDPQTLWPVEHTAIQRAIPLRQNEFAAGRTAAREAMARIGWPAEAIPSAPDRSPVWPRGLVGSIAHSARACVAITGRRDRVHAVGIDIEENCSMDQALWPTIATPSELATIESLPAAERGRWATRLFCAKEAFYKWQYPQTRQMLDFCDVQVTFRQNSPRFFVRPSASEKIHVLACSRDGGWLETSGILLFWLIGASATIQSKPSVSDGLDSANIQTSGRISSMESRRSSLADSWPNNEGDRLWPSPKKSKQCLFAGLPRDDKATSLSSKR